MTFSLIPRKKRKHGEQALSRASQDAEWNPFAELHREIDDVFDEFLSTFDRPFSSHRDWPLTRRSLFPARKGAELADPRIDVSETDDEVQITAELPGLDEKDIEVSLDEDALVIRGEKRHEQEEKKKDYHLMERSYGSFERIIPLMHGMDLEQVKAKFKKGVLHVTIAKSPEAKKSVKQIDIATD